MTETFGKRLRRLRQANRFTTRDMAQFSGVTHASIVRIENGEHKPRCDSLPPMAEALGVSIDYLLTGRDADAALWRAIGTQAPQSAMVALAPSQATAMRKCLRCQGNFKSSGFGNRVCSGCRDVERWR